MDSGGVRRKDTTKGPPLRVLSLDGGGVRGYSIFIIIQELMHRTFVEIEGRAPKRHEIPKPCDHFDLIVGTGTGGLIALMLGRLRLDLETCKELYVRMTRTVFQTDKTIAGIPYRSTLFKASKLEEAIKTAVQEHTVKEREGNDSAESPLTNPLNAASYSSAGLPRRNQSNASTVSFSARSPAAQMAHRPAYNSRYGDPNARLYDHRENRTKTAVTAVYKGSPRGTPAVLLRSYDSRKEPPPEFDCKIWQAGRATCSIGLAFKPITIGQSVFHDDGVGTFNPSPEALDEAVVNEWPGREVGVFVSVGTGRRPKNTDSNSQMWYEGFLGEFAEARRKLISKIEGCEKIHEYMMREHLGKRNVSIDAYYRLNVEVGVGEFGMNEWHRLGEISTGTRRYMSREAEQRMIQGISSKLGRIHRSRILRGRCPWRLSFLEIYQRLCLSPIALEAGHRLSQAQITYTCLTMARLEAPMSVYTRWFNPKSPPLGPRSPSASAPALYPEDHLTVQSPTPAQYHNHVNGQDLIAITGSKRGLSATHSDRTSPSATQDASPREPATWWSENADGFAPYPVDDDEPPPVNMARKPDYRGR
ncbi:hypothetical protein FCULG_00011516 [Fusarium culmorum]|uniref:PNPLA domain-containing protein n=1 Tax=Fusarium culmorum TaxID=5516 RepID=A0A2T4H5J6_FUSCU|nr:hypothetical protein FCULG_00011516 [Fusarium culmorum]